MMIVVVSIVKLSGMGHGWGVGKREIATLIEHLLARQYAKPFYMRYAI